MRASDLRMRFGAPQQVACFRTVSSIYVVPLGLRWYWPNESSVSERGLANKAPMVRDHLISGVAKAEPLFWLLIAQRES